MAFDIHRWMLGRTARRLTDGRDVFMVTAVGEALYVCCDFSVIERNNAGKAIPDPGEAPADDGYVTPWETVTADQLAP